MYIQNNHLRRTISRESMELQDWWQTHDACVVVNVRQGQVAHHSGPPLTVRWCGIKGDVMR